MLAADYTSAGGQVLVAGTGWGDYSSHGFPWLIHEFAMALLSAFLMCKR